MAARRPTSTAKKRSARGEPVVHDVLAATRVELARVGYRALRIEDVAARAKVHKTTVYRRWPTKVELVQETLAHMFEERFALSDTGSLRGDLLAIAKEMRAFFVSASGQCLVRMMMTEGTEGELRRIVESLRSDKEAVPKRIVAAALARGELREGIDGDFLMSTLVGSLQHQIFALGRAPKMVDVAALVDLILFGAMPRPAAAAPQAPGRAAKDSRRRAR